jgi:hypothetical protein
MIRLRPPTEAAYAAFECAGIRWSCVRPHFGHV